MIRALRQRISESRCAAGAEQRFSSAFQPPVGGSGSRRPEPAACTVCSRLAPRVPWVGRFGYRTRGLCMVTFTSEVNDRPCATSR